MIWLEKIFDEKTGKGTTSTPLQKLNPLEITPEKYNDQPTPIINDVEAEYRKSPNDLDFPE